MFGLDSRPFLAGREAGCSTDHTGLKRMVTHWNWTLVPFQSMVLASWSAEGMQKWNCSNAGTLQSLELSPFPECNNYILNCFVTGKTDLSDSHIVKEGAQAEHALAFLDGLSMLLITLPSSQYWPEGCLSNRGLQAIFKTEIMEKPASTATYYQSWQYCIHQLTTWKKSTFSLGSGPVTHVRAAQLAVSF